MNFTDDIDGVYRLFKSHEMGRRELEGWVSDKENALGYCTVCRRVTSMAVGTRRDRWVNLRGGMVCECGLAARFRSFVDGVRVTARGTVINQAFIAERVTPLYRVLSRDIHGLIGSEYLGAEFIPGEYCSTSETQRRIGDALVRHEDMQALSFLDGSLDLVMHSDVLEHVANPLQALKECRRVLRPGGVLVFACPIYAVPETRRMAEVRDGKLAFFGPEVYHGDPLNEKGVPVFNNFGFDLFELVKSLEYERVEIGFTSDYSCGYYSDSNPYPHALMWHIMVRAYA
jgi:SAM-dependent methyltransferase